MVMFLHLVYTFDVRCHKVKCRHSMVDNDVLTSGYVDVFVAIIRRAYQRPTVILVVIPVVNLILGCYQNEDLSPVAIADVHGQTSE